ncbi:hypothetical protein CBS101457_003813 [Exobasidium rhododendri]|nr:hypothetical protein CBS101457_003813 [Exobasidium rhododendri]
MSASSMSSDSRMSQYVLPSLLQADEDLVSASEFDKWWKRSSSRRSSHQSEERAVKSPTSSLSPSSIGPRTSSRANIISSASSFRLPESTSWSKVDGVGRLSGNSETNSPLPSAPILQKRQSSLTLSGNGRSRNNVVSFKEEDLSTTSSSAAPSLAISLSGTGARSDDEDVLSSTLSAFGADWYCLDSLNRNTSLNRRGSQAAGADQYDTNNMTFRKDRSFLPMSQDDSLSESGVTRTHKKRVVIDTPKQFQRSPNKVARLLGEEYIGSHGEDLRGPAVNQSSLSSSLASKSSALKGMLYIKGKMRKEEYLPDPLESEWEKAIRLEEEDFIDAKKKKEAMANTMNLLNQFSVKRQASWSNKAPGKKVTYIRHSDHKGGLRPREENRNIREEAAATEEIYPTPGLVAHPPRSRTMQQLQSSPVFDLNLNPFPLPPSNTRQHTDDSLTHPVPHRPQSPHRNIGSTPSSGRRCSGLVRGSSSSSLADGCVVHATNDGGGNNKDNFSRHSSTPSDLSSASDSIMSTPDMKSVLPLTGRKLRKSNSIDALTSMLQPLQMNALHVQGVKQQYDDEEMTSFANFGYSPSHSDDEEDIQRVEEQLFQPQVVTVDNAQSMQSLAKIHQQLRKQIEQERLAAKGLPSPFDSAVTSVLPTPDHLSRFPSVATMITPHSPEQTRRRLSIGDSVQHLPPLTSLYEECWRVNHENQVSPWKSEHERSKLLSSISPREVIPKGWIAYMRAYAEGDIDLNNPPAPRNALLLDKVAPRTSLSDSLAAKVFTENPHDLQNSPLHPKRNLAVFFPEQEYNVLPSLPSTPPLLQDILESVSSPPIAECKNGSSVVHGKIGITKDDGEDLRTEASTLTELGGMGNIRAPQPTWETERNASAKEYVDLFHEARRNSILTVLVEDLADQLEVNYASIQLLVGEERLLLATCGQEEVSRVSSDNFSTPRLDSFDFTLEEKRSTTPSKENILDFHTILVRDGNPLLIPELSDDWRFHSREDDRMHFYAGASIFSSDSALPIGTISVMHHQSKVLRREQLDDLMEAARAVERELTVIKGRALRQKLHDMDESISTWSKALDDRPHFQSTSTPPMSSPPLHASRLAERRIARKPVPIDTELCSFAPHEPNTTSTHLSSALAIIAKTLQVELVYVAQVGSLPLDCSIKAMREEGLIKVGNLRPNPVMHLRALAASKGGLRFDNDQDKVRQLLGEEMPLEGDEMSPFESALVAGCGSKEHGGGDYKATEGWVLAVASRGKVRLHAETGIYLRKFAAVIRPLLLRESPKHLVDLANSHVINKNSAEVASLSPCELSPASPFHSLLLAAKSSPSSQYSLLDDRRGSLLQGNKKKIPLASPPPNSPLPLLPGTPPSALRPNMPLRRGRGMSDPRSSGLGLDGIAGAYNNQLDRQSGRFRRGTVGAQTSALGLALP